MGCGAAQQPLGSTVSPQSSSSLRRHTSGQDLLYIDDYYTLYVYSFPQGQRQATGAGYILYGECSNPSGNVYIGYQTISGLGELLVYPHGQTAPKSGLPAKGGILFGECASDPATNNLAGMARGAVEIYLDQKYPPKRYNFPRYFWGISCAYDAGGNLFISGVRNSEATLLEMPSGKRRFITVALPSSLSASQGFIRWDGAYLALSDNGQIYRLTIHGKRAQIAGTTRLYGLSAGIGSFWIQDGYLAAATGDYGVTIWKYPSGKRVTVIKGVGSSSSGDLSVAVSH